MAIKLTKRVVDAEQKGDKDRYLYDSEVRGFGLKITPKGKKVFIFQYRPGGRGAAVRRFVIAEHGDLTPEEARNEAVKLRGRVRSGEDPQAEKLARAIPPPPKQTFADTADAYLAAAAKALRPATYKEWKRILDRDVTPEWKDKLTEDLTRSDVRDLIKKISDRGAETQANKTFARLRRLFNWAREQDVISSSPATGLKPTRKDIERDRVLSDDEIRWFWLSCAKVDWPFGPLFQILLLTAQRRDEVGGMAWGELNADRTTWTIPRERSKNDRAHEVHISSKAKAIIDTLPVIEADPDEKAGDGPVEQADWIFTTNGRTAVSGFSRAKERLDVLMIKAATAEAEEAGRKPPIINPWILHDLRRTAATGMAKAEIPPHVVDKILNHVAGTIKGVAAIYNRHGYAKEQAAALDRWAEQVTALVDGKKDGEAPDRNDGREEEGPAKDTMAA